MQAEYRYQMTDPQDDFDNSTTLLLRRFPRRTVLEQTDADWPVAERYLPHVLELVRKYDDAQKEEEEGGLKPTTEFCDLIANVI